MEEILLTGGRITEGVVRVGDTVRRPLRPNSQLVRALLELLHDCGFEAAPRYLGSDEQQREVFTFLPGDVPPDLDPAIGDEALAAAAWLIRRFHDATAGSALAGDSEVVCHLDLSPCNFVFRAGRPEGLIDFDNARPGERLQDLGYALFLWLNLGTDGRELAEQGRRITLFCRAYGIDATVSVIDAIVAAVAANIERIRPEGRSAATVWWQTQLDWLNGCRDDLAQHLLA